MSARSSRLADAEARRRAATDFAANLVVLAGAGTGKTSLLVERVLNAIGSGVAEIDRLAAITFTEKAAGELRVRLAAGLERLRALARGEPVDDEANEADRAHRHLTGGERRDAGEIAAHALAALEGLDRARVVTIHGYCAELLRQHPIEAGVDPDFLVDGGEQFESLGRRAWETFLTGELGSDASRPDLWRGLLERFRLESLGRGARQAADFGVPPSRLRPPFRDAAAGGLLAELAGRMAEEIGSMVAAQRGMTAAAAGYFDTMQTALAVIAKRGIEHARATVAAVPALARVLDGRGVPRADTKLRDVSAEEFNRLAGESKRLLRSLCEIDDGALGQVQDALAPFALAARESALAHGVVTFDGLLALARDLLRDHPEVRREVKRRYRMLLVDEFQDTDPLQYEIVLFLAEREEGDAVDAYAAELEPGRLFVVGDAKQSIYRFRGADFAAYRRAVQRISDQGGALLDLVANFRSVPGVLDPVNRLFSTSGGCWESSDYQPPYVPIVPARGGEATEPRVELWTVDIPDDARAEERREAEGRVVAEQIRRWVEDERSCAWRDITVLLRAFTNITFYLRPLRERGIPFVVDGGREFLQRPEVEQLLATLRTLSQPADEAALLAFLRSAAGGAPDTELADYAAAGQRWSWRRELDPARFPTIADRFSRLRELERDTRHAPADAVVRHVVERFDLLPLGGAAYEGAQRVANLRKLAAAAGELAADGRLGLDEIVEGLQEGRLIDLAADRPLADDAADAVRITSIHRMKGLENRRVVVPDLARRDQPHRKDEHEVLTVRLPDGEPSLSLRIDGVSNSSRVWHEREDRNHERAEETRVLYVALTRARERLYVVAGPSRGRAPWIEALRAWGYDPDAPPEPDTLLADGSVLHRRLRPHREGTRRESGSRTDSAEAVARYREAVGILRRGPAPLVRPSGVHEERERRLDPDPSQSGGGSRDLGRTVGIVLHRLLETWDGRDDEPLRQRLRRLTAEIATEEGVAEGPAHGEATDVLDSFLGSELARRWRGVEVLGREVPMLLRTEDGGFHGSIDLLYRDPDGAVVVADYKTDRDTDPARLSARYGDQLAVYAEATKRALGLSGNPRTELWSLRSGLRIPLCPSPGEREFVPFSGPTPPRGAPEKEEP